MNEAIQAFVDDKNIAIAGVSKNSNKFGNILMRALVKKGYSVFPVNPNTPVVEGVKAIPSIKELPGNVSNLILAVSPKSSESIAEECANTGVKRVWFISAGGKQPVSVNAVKKFEDLHIKTISDYCPMMFFSPKGIHGWHLWIKRMLAGKP